MAPAIRESGSPGPLCGRFGGRDPPRIRMTFVPFLTFVPFVTFAGFRTAGGPL
jgi:hypothetical protein